MAFYDIERENLAFVVVAASTLRQQSKKRKVGLGQLNILLAIHLLEPYSGAGMKTSDLADTHPGSVTLLRTNIRQLELAGHITRYKRYSGTSRRIRTTQKGKALIMQCLTALRQTANNLLT
jgi:DNA-binding MarR family transcriptional regulator